MLRLFQRSNMDTYPFPNSSIRLICATPDFWSFLSVRTGKICTSEGKAARELCRVLSVRRIRDINASPRALKAWRIVSAEFSLWLKRTYSPVNERVNLYKPQTLVQRKSEWPARADADMPVSYCCLRRVGPFINAFRFTR
jgi:hypothetical protein